jgi:hypothetical protein
VTSSNGSPSLISTVSRFSPGCSGSPTSGSAVYVCLVRQLSLTSRAPSLNRVSALRIGMDLTRLEI